METNDKTAVGLWFKDLVRMKLKLRGPFSRVRMETPDHFAILAFVLIGPKGFCRIFAQRKVRHERKTFVEAFGG